MIKFFHRITVVGGRVVGLKQRVANDQEAAVWFPSDHGVHNEWRNPNTVVVRLQPEFLLLAVEVLTIHQQGTVSGEKQLMSKPMEFVSADTMFGYPPDMVESQAPHLGWDYRQFLPRVDEK